MEKDLYNQEQSRSSVNIYGDIKGVQIQQGTIHSSQIQNNNQEFNYDKVAEILNEIDKYTPMFAEVYGENCKAAQDALDEAKDALSHEKPSLIKKSLSLLKDISLKVTTSVIAKGIIELLKTINI